MLHTSFATSSQVVQKFSQGNGVAGLYALQTAPRSLNCKRCVAGLYGLQTAAHSFDCKR